MATVCVHAEIKASYLRRHTARVTGAGGAASFVWGPDNLHLRIAEHIGGQAFELWFAHERLAEAGPYANADARDAAMLQLVDALETRWRALAAAQP